MKDIISCPGNLISQARTDIPPNNPLTSREKRAMQHSNKLGAGAKAREHLKGQEKVGVVMKEFYRGTLHSGSGHLVPPNRPDIAKAIAMSEAGLSKKKK